MGSMINGRGNLNIDEIIRTDVERTATNLINMGYLHTDVVYSVQPQDPDAWNSPTVVRLRVETTHP